VMKLIVFMPQWEWIEGRASTLRAGGGTNCE